MYKIMLYDKYWLWVSHGRDVLLDYAVYTTCRLAYNSAYGIDGHVQSHAAGRFLRKLYVIRVHCMVNEKQD